MRHLHILGTDSGCAKIAELLGNIRPQQVILGCTIIQHDGIEGVLLWSIFIPGTSSMKNNSMKEHLCQMRLCVNLNTPL